MKRKKIFIIMACLLSTLLFITNLNSEDLIIYNDEKSIILIDILGEIKKKIEIPYLIESDWTLKKNMVFFSSKDNIIRCYNWENKTEIKIPQGPFLYSGSGYGPEIYKNIDFSLKNNIITFDVRPEYSIDMPGDVNAKKYYYDDLFELSEIFMINLKDLKVIRITNAGSSWNPLIYENKIIYLEAVSIFIYHIVAKEKINLTEIYSKGVDFGFPVGFGLMKIIDDDLIFYEYNYNDGRLRKIISFDLKKNKFDILFNFDDKNLKRSIFSNFVSDISLDKKNLLLIENRSKIYSFNLKSFEIKLIKETCKNFSKAKFY